MKSWDAQKQVESKPVNAVYIKKRKNSNNKYI